jgi:hypothetical protein
LSSSSCLLGVRHFSCSLILKVELVPPSLLWPSQSAKGAHPYRKACRLRGIKVAAPPLDSPCDGLVTYPGDSKHYSKNPQKEEADWHSFLVKWDISASTVQMHLHKQQQSNWRIVSKSKALLILYTCIPSQAGPEHYTHF